MRREFIWGMAAIGLLFSTTAAFSQTDQEQFNSMMDGFLQDDENVEKIGNALERFFRQKRLEQQRSAVDAERDEMERQFRNPVDVPVGNSPTKGPEDAPITIVEFSDFQCPFCKRGAETVAEVVKAYPNQIRLVFKNMPLAFHPHAKPAARAALAAGRQDKFWEYRDKLFERQTQLGDDLYPQLAEELGLDVARFKKDLEDPAIAAKVDEDEQLAQKLEVRGTPNFFVNGVQLRGAQPVPKFKEVIDRWLEKKQ